MNSQSQELSQAELIALAEQAGFNLSHHPDIALASHDDIAKFAQLLLQREGGEAAPVAYMRTVKVAGSPDTPPEYDIEFQTEPYGDAEKWTPLYAQQPTAPGGEVENQCSYRLEASLDYLERILSKIGVIDPGATNGDGPLLFLAAEIYLGEPQ